MKIYLDNCSLQRPPDSRTRVRIILEAEAALGILTLCEAGDVELVASEALLFEINQNPNPARKKYALEALTFAKSFIHMNNQIEVRAKHLLEQGFQPLDALHLASAESAETDYLCTTDDKLIKRTKAVKDLKIKVVSPTELIEEIEE